MIVTVTPKGKTKSGLSLFLSALIAALQAGVAIFRRMWYFFSRKIKETEKAR